MKKLGLLVAIILASSAFIVTEVVADDWNGPYVGLQGGYIWGDADTSAFDTGAPPAYSLSLDPDGFAGGIFAGYMWLFGNDILIGIEGEWNGASADDLKVVNFNENSTDYYYGGEVEQDWDASLRLNAGKRMGDYMLYFTGGMAWAKINIVGFTSWWPYPADENDTTLLGWTIGVGLERKINENIHARIQYRYSDYGDDTWTLAPINDYDSGKIEYKNSMFTLGLSYCF